MNKPRFIKSGENSLLKGALYDSKDPRIADLAETAYKLVDEFSIYDQNTISREALIFHYKQDNSKVVGVELCTVDIGTSGPKYIDAYVKTRMGHIGKVPAFPYALRVAREGNRLYRLFYPVSASMLGMESDR